MAPKPFPGNFQEIKILSYLSFQFLRHIGMPSSPVIHDGDEIFSEVTLLKTRPCPFIKYLFPFIKGCSNSI